MRWLGGFWFTEAFCDRAALPPDISAAMHDDLMNFSEEPKATRKI
jgi:hypothetical protein